LIRCLAQIEATIDFPDEELPQDLIRGVVAQLAELRAEWVAALAESRGRQIRDGYRIAIVGRPNAGKSTLFNGLIGRDAAIVAPIEGTTRDVIEATAILGGYRVILADMAGLRETKDPVEEEGVRRATAWAAAADLRLWVRDLSRIDTPDFTGEICAAGDWIIGTKSDLAQRGVEMVSPFSAGWVGQINSYNRGDIGGLQEAISAHLAKVLTGRDFPATTRARHRAALSAGVEALDRAIDRAEGSPELFGEDVRLAARALERVTGHIDSESVLDEVFSSFCIGK